jgi:hypothetical protein
MTQELQETGQQKSGLQERRPIGLVQLQLLLHSMLVLALHVATHHVRQSQQLR